MFKIFVVSYFAVLIFAFWSWVVKITKFGPRENFPLYGCTKKRRVNVRVNVFWEIL